MRRGKGAECETYARHSRAYKPPCRRFLRTRSSPSWTFWFWLPITSHTSLRHWTRGQRGLITRRCRELKATCTLWRWISLSGDIYCYIDILQILRKNARDCNLYFYLIFCLVCKSFTFCNWDSLGQFYILLVLLIFISLLLWTYFNTLHIYLFIA